MMNLKAQKLQLIQKLINIEEESLIIKINKIIDNEYTSTHKPMSLDDFYSRIAASEEAIEKGKFTRHDDFREEIKSWAKSR